MRKIKVRNFGPIGVGLDSGDGFINITKVTAFIGSQGSGKSSIAKLVSTFSWIEKALNRGDFSAQQIASDKFFKDYFAYQQIADYFKKDTYLEYQGDAYEFVYKNDKLTVKEAATDNIFVTPQIMYVPGERNFLSVVENAERIKSLPEALFTFFEVYDKARNSNLSIELPIGKIAFQFNAQDNSSWIVGDDFRLKLSQAASGFQSYIPLYIVTKYLAENIGNKKSGYRALSLEEQTRLDDELSDIDKLKDDKQYKQRLARAYNRYVNSCFVNIVEEPEQNLYPTSQKLLLYELMKYANQLEHNQLIFTTHSPYLINYLSIAAKAYDVYSAKKNSEQARLNVSKIVPIESLINPEFISVYQLNEDGTITLLEKNDNIPSDNNFLNNSLRDTNRAIVELMEIEDDSF